VRPGGGELSSSVKKNKKYIKKKRTKEREHVFGQKNKKERDKEEENLRKEREIRNGLEGKFPPTCFSN
jgi:hypothetical protein